jgi:hypothetical protein
MEVIFAFYIDSNVLDYKLEPRSVFWLIVYGPTV